MYTAALKSVCTWLSYTLGYKSHGLDWLELKDQADAILKANTSAMVVAINNAILKGQSPLVV